MRLFLAFALPEVVKADLMELQARGRRAGWQGSWPVPETMHLTLAFLGEQPPGALPALQRVAARSAAGVAPMVLQTGLLGGFPSGSAARVAWLGVEPRAGLLALATGLRRGLTALGVRLDPRPFQPHLTFGRLRSPADLAALGQAPPSVSFSAEALDLVESRLDSGGARHRVIEAFPLG